MDSLIARSEYAALDSCVYLNQAALGLIPTRSMSAMLRFMSEVAQYGNLRLSDDEEVRVYSTSFVWPRLRCWVPASFGGHHRAC